MDAPRIELFRDVAMKLVNDSCGSNIPAHVKQAAISVLLSRLAGYMNPLEAMQRCYSLLGTHRPAEFVNEIVSMSTNPWQCHRTQGISNLPDTRIPSSRSKARTWTQYEDQRLLAGVWRFGVNNWPLVAQFVGNQRTRSQCSQRWNRGLNPVLDKGPWTSEEEQKLLDLVTIHGERSWTRVASSLGHRSDVQCRYRYHQIKKKRAVGTTNAAVVASAAKILQENVFLEDIWADGDSYDTAII